MFSLCKILIHFRIIRSNITNLTYGKLSIYLLLNVFAFWNYILTQLVAASSWSNAALSLSVYLHYWSLFQLMCSVPPDLNYRFCYDCFTSKIVFKKAIKSWINYITLSFWCKYDCLILHPLMKFMQRMKY